MDAGQQIRAANQASKPVNAGSKSGQQIRPANQ